MSYNTCRSYSSFLVCKNLNVVNCNLECNEVRGTSHVDGLYILPLLDDPVVSTSLHSL